MPYPLNAYGDAMKNLAYINNCAYADYVGRQVTNTDMIDLGLIRSDDEVHFTAAGQQDVATFLSGILLDK